MGAKLGLISMGLIIMGLIGLVGGYRCNTSMVAWSFRTIASSCCSRMVLVVAMELVGELMRDGIGEMLPEAALA